MAEEIGLVKAASGVVRVAAASWWHLATWTVEAGVTGTTYVVRRAVEGEPATAPEEEQAP